MTVLPGSRLGPYEIDSALGAGGMGEVFKARDTRLGRNVAIKVLSAEVANHASFKTRFEREAKTISQLNHPHICTLYDIGHDNGTDYIVMELIDGESLADRIARGPLSTSDALRYGIEIAGALDGAHRQNVVHRDLKPGNVMLTRTGAKLLDFGLAKGGAEALDRRRTAVGESPETVQKPLTQEGTIVGTLQYMAPEQLEGAEADARTDIFAFGALMYEMVTGRRAFEAKTRTSLIAAIVAAHPTPVSQIEPLTPPALEHVIERCLQKEPDDRWQSARDVAEELKWIRAKGSQAGVAAPVSARRRTRDRFWIGTALAVGIAALFAVAGWMRNNAIVRELEAPIRFSFPAPPGASFGPIAAPVISPDGRKIAFNGRREGVVGLWIRPLDDPNAKFLPGTERGLTVANFAPFWSPDSQSIAFFADGKLKRVSLNGGPPQVICDATTPRGGSWNEDGTILFAASTVGPLQQVSSAGGVPVPVLDIDRSTGEESQRWPFFLPNGRDFLYLSQGGVSVRRGVWLASLGSKKRTKIVESDAGAVYAAGQLLFVRDSALFAQPLNLRSGKLTGEARRVVDDVARDTTFGVPGFSATARALSYRTGGVSDFQMTWFDRSGKTMGTLGPLGLFDHPSLSRDGKFAAFDSADPRTDGRDVWLADIERETISRFTFGPAINWMPAWSSDSTAIAFISDGDGVPQLYVKSMSGTEPERKLGNSAEGQHHPDWSVDGRFIVQERSGKDTKTDLWITDPATGKARPIVATQFVEHFPRISPDGRWLSYTSNESGREEVYVRSFPAGGGKWLVSLDGGAAARWRGDSKELFYIAGAHLMAVSVGERNGRFEPGKPQALFDPKMYNNHAWDVTADGQRFLFPVLSEHATASPIEVVINWQSLVAPRH